MIFKQSIEAGSTNELNRAGRHIKVINAASALRLRVFNDEGSVMLDSEVRSGFELEMPPFGKATVTSQTQQSYEIWVSADKLGYNAPSANANNLNSYTAKHYGDTDMIVPFEPSRLSVKVVSDAPWWYGGSNVDSGSLPHRQLRNSAKSSVSIETGSLPHRQLRKLSWGLVSILESSLPHRQLRKLP